MVMMLCSLRPWVFLSETEEALMSHSCDHFWTFRARSVPWFEKASKVSKVSLTFEDFVNPRRFCQPLEVLSTLEGFVKT